MPMLVANDNLFGKPTGWLEPPCGDAIPAPLDGYVLVPWPANSDNVLDVTSLPYKSIPLAQAGPPQYLQLPSAAKGSNMLEAQVGGPITIMCYVGIK